jgi:signal transduction histidine kinase
VTPADAACAAGEPGPTGAGHEPHAWTRFVGGWHAGFWLVVTLAAVWAAAVPDLAASRRGVALGLLALLAGTYLATVQRGILGQGPGSRFYLAVAIAVTGAGIAIQPALAMLLFILYPQTWRLSGGRSGGALWSGLLTVVASVGFVANRGFTAEAWRDVAPQTVVSLVISLLLGFWISGIISQSSDRADLIAQLELARADLATAERARGVADERERLAREIHDTLAQGFASVVMLAQAAAPLLARDPDKAGRQLELIEQVARENLDEARALVAASAPAGLDGTTLPDAVRRLTERFGQETGIEVDAELAPVTRLDRDREVVVLRAVQEALSNVRRHAGARRVAVRLVEDLDGALVEVGDDGQGFPHERHRAGYGLAGMRARVREVGGELDVASTPGGGTRLTVRLPAVAP